MLAERVVRRREAEAVRVPLARRAYLPAHFRLPPFVPSHARSSSVSSADSAASLSASSMLSGLGAAVGVGSGYAARGVDGVDGQADLSRLTNTVKSLVEVNERCWRGEGCELCGGVRQGLVEMAAHTQKHSDALEHRVSLSPTYLRYEGIH